MRGFGVNSQYAAGFTSALLLLAAGSLFYQAAVYASNQPSPQAFLEFLYKPLLSLADVFTVLVLVMLVTAVVMSTSVMGRSL